MKKYLFPLVMLSAMLPCTAQDTVRWDDPWYLFNQKPVYSCMPSMAYFDDCSYVTVDDTFYYRYSMIGADFLFKQKYFIDKSRPIYGIAVTGCFSDAYPPIEYLYQQDSNGARYLVDSVTGALNYSKYCFFVQEYFYPHEDWWQNYSHPFTTPCDIVVPCTELYFERPKYAEDTIVLVWNNPNNYVTIDEDGNWTIQLTDWGRIYYILDAETPNPIYSAVHSHTPNEWINYGWGTSYINDRQGVIFPIVELRCRGEVPVARVEEKGSGWARVSWTPDYVEDDYMVGVGRYGTEPADSLIFEVPRGDTTFTITGLENGYPYAVWVRRGCRYAPGGYDTVVWGEWGRYASLYLPPDTTGILAADESGELKVYPNPAHGVLTVDLNEVNDVVVELALSDLGGREVLRTKAERPLTKVDVGALPAGLYLLQAASPGKVYRRRVAVE